MKVTSYDLLEMGIADEIIKEPNGSAHIDIDATSQLLKETIIRNFTNLKKYKIEDLIEKRIEKYSNIGSYDKRK